MQFKKFIYFSFKCITQKNRILTCFPLMLYSDRWFRQMFKMIHSFKRTWKNKNFQVKLQGFRLKVAETVRKRTVQSLDTCETLNELPVEDRCPKGCLMSQRCTSSQSVSLGLTWSPLWEKLWCQQASLVTHKDSLMIWVFIFGNSEASPKI